MDEMTQELNRLQGNADTIWFGQYKGELWIDLPRQYLIFLIKQMKSPGIKAKAKKTLNKLDRHG